MNRKSLIILTVLILVVSGFFIMKWLSGFKKGPVKKTPPPITRYVKAQPVSYSNLPGIIQTSGRLRAFDEIIISSEVGGRLERGDHIFKTGQFFRKGELIARVVNDEFTYQLRAQKSNFLKSIANILPDLKIDFPESYPQWMDFFESIDINKPLPEIPSSTSSKERIFMASRNILNEYYSIKSNEVRYTKYFIHAPYDGSLKEVSMQAGSVVNPGVRLGIFTRTDLFEVEVPVRVQNINLISVNTKADLYDDSGFKHKGYVSRVGEVINTATNTVSVFVAVKNTREFPMFDGMYLNVVLHGKDVPEVMEMPRNAVYNGSEVYIIKDGKLEKREINVLKLNDETLYFNGLKPGEMVVTEAITGITGNATFKPLSEK
ncbi:MAG: HlyD family efflux transporter periplasmic adaptor subunit [Chlorobi bacterium]|nr:HlyD family efflux transporter periplasmic adaptor subunit [Chlorobiota bacterium]